MVPDIDTDESMKDFKFNDIKEDQSDEEDPNRDMIKTKQMT
jgi:hypothetical protein